MIAEDYTIKAPHNNNHGESSEEEMGDSSTHAALGLNERDGSNIINNTSNNNSSGSAATVAGSLLKPSNTIECGHCQIQRPKTARHCSYCEVCIDDLDHHCPWSGKCIGKDNIAAFYIFISALCFQLYYIIGVFIYYMLFVTQAIKGLPVGPSF